MIRDRNTRRGKIVLRGGKVLKSGEVADVKNDNFISILLRGNALTRVAADPDPGALLLPEDRGSQPTKKVDLGSLQVKVAKAVIEREDDDEKISEWLKAETRKSVRKALVARRENILLYGAK